MLNSWIPGPSYAPIGRILGGGGLVDLLTRAAVFMSGGVATIYIIMSAYLYITANGEKGQIDKAKQGIQYSLVGFAAVLMALGFRNAVNTFLGI